VLRRAGMREVARRAGEPHACRGSESDRAVPGSELDGDMVRLSHIFCYGLNRPEGCPGDGGPNAIRLKSNAS
jgi:hypothetical protein